MARKKSLKTYTVGADITLKFATIEIQAESLEEALEKARSLDVGDFCDPPERNDDKLELLGLWENP